MIELSTCKSSKLIDETINAIRINEDSVIIKIDDKSDYDIYFDKRNKDKKQTYYRVLKTAGAILFVSLFLLLGSNLPYLLMSLVCVISSTFIRVLGMCIYSTIPSEELDFIDMFLTKKTFKAIASISIATLTVIQLIITIVKKISWFYFSSSLLLVTGCFWLAMLHSKVTYFYITLNIYMLFLVASMGITSMWIVPFLYFRQFSYVWFACNLASVLIMTICTTMILLYLYTYLQENKKLYANKDQDLSEEQTLKRAALTSNLINKSLYTLFFTLGITYFFGGISFQFGVPIEYTDPDSDFYYTKEFYYLQGLFDLLPFIMIVTFGKRKCFTIVSRLFELQLGRLQDDGASLSELISQTNTTNQNSKDIWVFRRKESTKHGKIEGFIDRRFWFQGRIIKRDPEQMIDTIEVDISSDKRLAWEAKFSQSGSELEYQEYPEYSNGSYHPTNDASQLIDVCTTEEWISNNLDETKVKVVLRHSEKVQFQVSRKISETKSKDSKDFKKWIDKNLRKFEWINFENDLFKRSPRELSTESDKTYTYGLSSKLNLRSISDIDYFISHSWNDNAGHKVRALRKFVRSFQNFYSRDPVIWLDKVCIDQREPDDAIAALPLIICSCNKVLVMMSESYMRRLWCVW